MRPGRNGIAAGLAAVLGTLLGDFIYMAAAVAGLAAALKADPILFETLQWLGAGYLCWMGWRLLHVHLEGIREREEPRRSARTCFRQACAVSLTNPKVILFFVAFFPLFLAREASPVTLAVMMAHVVVISLMYQTALVPVGNAVAARLRGLPAARTVATRLAGIALIGFGIKLALGNR